MFYKPKFCCNCGEKIERIDWRLWTSRRFCDVCAIEQKGYELLPRVIIGIAFLFGIFGIGSYFQDRTPVLSKSELNTVGAAGPKRTVAAESKRQPEQSEPSVYGLEGGKKETQATAAQTTESPVAAATKEQPKIRNIASDEPVYYCGAMTKKGKPCTRRVKSSNQRCWQHAGQPSAVNTRKVPDVF